MSTTTPVTTTAKAPRPRARTAPRRPARPAGSARDRAVAVTPEAMRATLATVELELLERYPDADLAPVEAAFEFAARGARRPEAARAASRTSPTRSRSPAILAELGLDPVAVQAALLHDIPEDTEHSLADLEERFGAEVAHLVDGVTKLSKFSALSHEEQQAENIRKMFLAMAEDIRVVLIKLADRLHNMRTLGALPLEKQQRIARQTAGDLRAARGAPGHLAVQVGARGPLASRCSSRRPTGASRASSRATAGPARPTSSGPWRCSSVALDRGRHQRRALRAAQAHLSASTRRCSARTRSSARSTTSTRCACSSTTCATATPRWASCTPCGGPSPGSSTTTSRCPRTTCYQSLHTAVVALDGKPLEVQIRTHEMHRVSEVGIAAHWRYKEGSPLRPRLRRQARLAAPAHGLAARGVGRHRVRGGRQARHLPGPGVRVHAPGRRQGPARGRDAARLRVPHPHRRRSRVHRRQGQQPPRAARLQAEERRHRRDRHDQAAPTGRRATGSTSSPRATPRRRSASGSSASSATRTSPTGGSRSTASCAASRGPRSRRSPTTSSRSSPTSTASQTVDDFYAAIGYGAVSAQSVVTRLGVADDVDEVAAPGRAAGPPRTGRRPRQGRRRPAGPLRQVLPPHPGRPHRGLHLAGPRRHGPPATCHDLVNERDRRPAHRGRVGDRGAADLSHRHPRRGLRPDRACCRDISNVVADPRSTSSRRTCPSQPDHRATVQATLQVTSVAQLARVMSRLEQLKDVVSVQRDHG